MRCCGNDVHTQHNKFELLVLLSQTSALYCSIHSVMLGYEYKPSMNVFICSYSVLPYVNLKYYAHTFFFSFLYFYYFIILLFIFLPSDDEYC